MRPSHVLLRSRIAVAAAVGLAVTLTFLAAFAHDSLLTVDEPLTEWFRSSGSRRFWLVTTQVGGEVGALAIGLGVALVLWSRCRVFALGFPIALVGAIVLNVTLKSVIDRPRPPAADVGVALASFPSGHVIMAVVLLGLLPPVMWILTNRLWIYRVAVGALFVLVPLVAASRVALGAHWATDVIGSVFVGAAVLLATEYAVSTITARRACECAFHIGLPG